MKAIAVENPACFLSRHPNRDRLKKTFSFSVLLGALLVAGVFVEAQHNLPGPNTWWRAAAGERIISTQALPRSNVYNGALHINHWVAYEWECNVFIALAARLGGLQGLTALLIRLSTLFTLLLYGYAYLKSRSALAAFASCALMLPVMGKFLTLGPHLLGDIFLAASLITLERFRQGAQKTLWILPVIFAVWVNIHGTFVLGLLVLGAYWLCGLGDFRAGRLVAAPWPAHQRRHLLLVMLLCVLALTFTPYGTSLAAYPFELFASHPFSRALFPGERAGLTPAWAEAALCVFVLAALGTALLRSACQLEEAALLLLVVCAVFTDPQWVPFGVLVVTPLIAARLAPWLPDFNPHIQHHAWNAAIMASIIAGMSICFPSRIVLEQAATSSYPQRALRYLRQSQEPEPILNESDWSGYLAWNLSARQETFSPGWPGVYESEAVFQDLPDLTRNGSTTQFILQEYGIRTCLLTPQDPLGTLLATFPDWKRVYLDNVSVIFVRRGSAPSDREAATSRRERNARGPRATLPERPRRGPAGVLWWTPRLPADAQASTGG